MVESECRWSVGRGKVMMVFGLGFTGEGKRRWGLTIFDLGGFIKWFVLLFCRGMGLGS